MATPKAKDAQADAARAALHGLRVPRRRKRRSAPRGSSPGTMGELAGPDPVIRLIAYTADAFEERTLENVEEIATLVADRSRVVWLDVGSFGDGKVIARIGEILGIHPLAMADVVNVPQRPKADVYGDDRLMVVTQMARIEAAAVDVEQVSIALGPGFVVTFQEHPGDVFEPVRERIRQGARVRRMGPDFLLYALLDAVIDGYFPVVEAIGNVVESLEEEVLDRPTRSTLRKIHAVRRSLVALHRMQWRQRDACGALLRDVECPITDAVRVYLRDAFDHAFQTVDAIETQREMASSLMELYLSSASNRMNQAMRTLTVVATIFIPLTFLVGVYGMNFEYMPELHWRWGYPAVWVVMIAVAVSLVVWFRRQGWIEPKDDA
ncbi:MAG TPA: magnesium/cobalt transporter CorA [Myxococcota bacterium]|nr:magnesium/cobalt transporter CorA [Myxococcota bacterium]